MLPTDRPIRPLPDHLINQIAAGEVVERPASIVKELVENSLDAGAGAIRIEVRAGGVELIAVEDDGHGIPGAELALALQRHCTSKIAGQDDLARIVSLGFRGEALASIGAVAVTTLTSRADGAPHAYTVTAVPGQPLSAPAPASRPRGTAIEVRELFATVPARRQFLRRAASELLAIQQLVRGIAFCCPAVSFTLGHDGRRHWHAPAARDERTHAQRWRTVFGTPFAREAQPIDIATDTLRVYGWVGPPTLARGQSDLQFLALNGRLIRDRQLLHGIRLAFGDSLPAGRYASFALHLEMDPGDVDVNVHPNKTEVRFRHVRVVHDVLYAAVRQALGEVAGTARPPATVAAGTMAPPPPVDWQVREVASSDRAPPAAAPPAPARSGAAVPGALVGDRFLPLADDAGLVILDLPALVRAALLSPGATRTRALLFPVRVPMPPGPTHGLALGSLAAWGLEFTPIGPLQWVLRAIPAVLPELDPERLVRVLLADPFLHDDPMAALVRAATAALRWPADLGARAAWLANWVASIEGGDAARARHVRALDAAALAHLFDRP